MATITTKITVRGTVTEDGATKSVTLATFGNLNMTKVISQMISTAEGTEAFLKKVQEVTSAKVTGATVAVTPVFDSGAIGEPGDKLDSSEIFQEDFSGTTVVPTLNMVNVKDSDNKKVSYNVKYMADPVDTTDFETKVNDLAEALMNLSQEEITFDSANMTFTAKDEILRAD